MRDYSRSHVRDADLVRNAKRRSCHGRRITAHLLADIAEIDLRQLYREYGYSSLFTFCVEELWFSEDETYKRTQAARAARRFPVLFAELEQGRLHLSSVCLLAPHLTEENFDELVAASARKHVREVDQFLKQRFPEDRPRPVGPTIRAIPSKTVGPATQQVEEPVPDLLSAAPEPIHPLQPIELPPPRFLFQAEMDEETRDDVRAIQELLGHAIPSGDGKEMFKRMAKFYRAHLEKKRFGSKTPRRARPSRNPRHVPAQARQAVVVRDRGKCTFVGSNGQRCSSRKLLQFDHERPVAQGGTTTADNLRLRCRAHNQLEAERVFGAEFMRQKRNAQKPP